MPKFNIVYGDRYIQILKGNKEIVYWDREEWIEDPEVVFSIAYAIELACKGTLKIPKIA